VKSVVVNSKEETVMNMKASYIALKIIKSSFETLVHLATNLYLEDLSLLWDVCGIQSTLFALHVMNLLLEVTFMRMMESLIVKLTILNSLEILV